MVKIDQRFGITICLAGFLFLAFPSPDRLAAQELSQELQASVLRLTFGADRLKPGDVSGSVSVERGQLLQLSGWRLRPGDQLLPPGEWKIQLRRLFWEDQPDQPRPLSTFPRHQTVFPVGLDLQLQARETTALTLSVAGQRVHFKLADLRYGQPLRYPGLDLQIDLVPTYEEVSTGKDMQFYEHDYPSIMLTSQGEVWIAWQAYRDEADRIFVRRLSRSKWSEPEQASEAGDLFRVELAEDNNGGVWLVWSERKGHEWHLFAKSYQQGRWSAVQQLTRESTPNAFHQLVRDSNGRVHLVWVGYRDGQSYVFHSYLSGNRWSKPQEISGPSAWSPQAAVDTAGNIYVTWDSYRHGNYDIFLRQIRANGEPGPLIQVTRSPVFQAHPAIAIDRQGRVWLAWDESGAN